MKKSFLLSVLLCVLSVVVLAEEVPTITVRKSDRISLTLLPVLGSEGLALTRVLQKDLDLSGWFALLGKGQASYVVSGTTVGGCLQGKVQDASGGNVLSKNYTGTARGRAHLFADDIVRTLTGKNGIASKRVAFVSTRTGKKEIYLCDYDGHSVIQLTHDANLSVRPALGMEGRKLAYTGYQSGYADIYIVDIGSGSRQRIVKFPGTNSGAAFSPDGNRIACTVSRDGKPEIYVVGISGAGAYRVTRTPGVAASPTWSPDGREIIYVGDESGGPQLYRISAHGGGSGERISTGFRYCTEPSWSPDGRKVAFNVRTDGAFSVAAKDLVTGTTRVLATGENPAWGADSRHLIFSEGSSLILLDSQTGRRTNVLSGFGRLSEPAWAY